MTLGMSIDFAPGHHPKAAVRRIDGISERAVDATTVFERIRRSLLRANRARMSEGGHSDWAPLVDQYRRAKARKGLDPRLERATGALERAMTTASAPGSVARISRLEATFGTDLRQAVFAQRSLGRRRRRVLVITRKQRKRWANMIQKHLTGGDQ